MADAACTDTAQSNTPAYQRAVAVVERLPEFQRWSKLQKTGVIFQAPTDRQVTLHGLCFWSVSVSADAPDRWMPWNTFYIDLPNGNVLVEDIDSGDAISLHKWRLRARLKTHVTRTR
jgi:hypothetical protein